MWVLKERRLYVARKANEVCEFQSLEVIGINELAYAFVLLVSNLSGYVCLILENRVNESFGAVIVSLLFEKLYRIEPVPIQVDRIG